MIDKNSIQVIIRSAGERTEEVCSNLLENECGFKHFRSIHEVPFSKAISRGFEIGLESGKPWMLCIDADVLVDKDGIGRLLDVALALPESVFEVQGLVRDKFFPVNRPAGNHLYRLKYAEEALKCIPAEGTSLRPENTMLNVMSSKGYPYFQSDAVVGIHDFYQYYGDIFRKCYLHAKKHGHLLQLVCPYWIAQSKHDADFDVALMASVAAFNSQEKVRVSANFTLEEAEAALKKLGLHEKETLKPLDDSISNISGSFLIPEYMMDLQLAITPLETLNQVVHYKYKVPTFNERLKGKIAYELGKLTQRIPKNEK